MNPTALYRIVIVAGAVLILSAGLGELLSFCGGTADRREPVPATLVEKQ